MDFKKILILVLVSSLLVGCVWAAGISDFKVDDTYQNLYGDDEMSIFADEKNETGILIYLDVEDTNDTDDNDTEVLDEEIFDDGEEYLTEDDDLKLDVNSDNIANFTDTEHSTIGVSEVVELDGNEYVVVIWTISEDMDFDKLMSTIKDFNKENNVEPVAF